jgi:hypothetical protein
MENITFEKFLKDNLSFSDYESLPQVLGMTPKMFTMSINDPKRLSAQHIGIIAGKLMKTDVEFNSQFLIDKFLTQAV